LLACGGNVFEAGVDDYDYSSNPDYKAENPHYIREKIINPVLAAFATDLVAAETAEYLLGGGAVTAING
jgi:hypothetical protein